jgi:hypothetical protein
MERRMTCVRALSVWLLVIGFGLAAGPNHADAAAIPALTGKSAAPLVQKADYWHRYYRQHGYPPPAVVPAPVVVAPPALNPPIVAEVPVRPASCGEFHFWDGERCVDARFNKPYLGPVQSR